jgi:hypothetical protein
MIDCNTSRTRRRMRRSYFHKEHVREVASEEMFSIPAEQIFFTVNFVDVN